MTITIDPVYTGFDIQLHLGALTFEVEVAPSPQGLITTIEEGASLRREDLLGQAASTDPIITQIREAFRETGKDPSRYRPSSESLTRRVISGKDLYLVNNVVDCGNLVSLMTGIPVGCYNVDTIAGDICLTVGNRDQTYEGIGRGPINLTGLPILCDDIGPFGSPFSDSLRTAVTPKTTNLLFVLYGLNIDAAFVESAAEMADTLITTFCQQD
ncbi:hypothetical protein GCM10017044_08870 [Kordiimonas sediminis]|uniref:B3/B4 tRNA-binding domain-containing protein n=1 Tax=Kordiimonas sediminis TaxID=1735581 RepID=A0A919E644_9PROT|nr:phenylalanine--tRNA ligase beta subunit-related protein [Kordiimonas sediminis]GHF16760.1 hypothetical protein GCM10017044_08870 [Kordiimonas sediminis]